MSFFAMYQAVGLLLMSVMMAVYVVQQRRQLIADGGSAPLLTAKPYVFASVGGGGGRENDPTSDASPGASATEMQTVACVYAGYKHCCVINMAGQYITFVQVHMMDYGGEIRQEPQYYTLGKGETLVDTAPPFMRPHAGAAGFVSPRWSEDTHTWEEAATAAEIAAWEAEHPAPTKTADQVRTQRDKLLAETDWTQVLDAPIDAVTREAYRTYRQALRDIPEQAGFPGDIIWPELPAVGKAAPDPVDAAFDTLLGGENNA